MVTRHVAVFNVSRKTHKKIMILPEPDYQTVIVTVAANMIFSVLTVAFAHFYFLCRRDL